MKPDDSSLEYAYTSQGMIMENTYNSRIYSGEFKHGMVVEVWGHMAAESNWTNPNHCSTFYKEISLLGVAVLKMGDGQWNYQFLAYHGTGSATGFRMAKELPVYADMTFTELGREYLERA
jgi:hypothetical protein